MRALCLITIKPGTVDKVVKILKKKRKFIREIMVVAGRADISVVLQGPIDEINNAVIGIALGAIGSTGYDTVKAQKK